MKRSGVHRPFAHGYRGPGGYESVFREAKAEVGGMKRSSLCANKAVCVRMESRRLFNPNDIQILKMAIKSALTRNHQ
jgi:hypothetical protein